MMGAMPNLTKLTFDGPFASLRLNRPEARNALSLDLLASLHNSIDEVLTHPEIRVLTITGEGRAFCAGMDLKAVLDDNELAKSLLRSLAELTLKIRALPMVTVAKVNGAAIGGGCGLACVCDLTISHADAKIGYPEVDLGVCPAVVAPWLVKKIGPGRARRVLLQGGVHSGEVAHQIGMVDILVPAATDLDAATDSVTSRLAAGGPNALRATKALLNKIDGSDDPTLVLEGAALSASVLASPEAQSMLRAKLAAKPGS